MNLEYALHPAAIFPKHTGKTFAELVDSVRDHGGLIHPIVRIRAGKSWMVLDGEARQRACIEAKVQPTYADYSGDDPIGYVIAANLRRRHLNESQRAIVAARLKMLGPGRPKKGGSHAALSQRQAGHLLDVDPRTIRDARKVLARAAPEVVAAIDKGELAVTAAAELAKLPKKKQRELLAVEDKSTVRAAARTELHAPQISAAIRLAETDMVALRALAVAGVASKDPRARAGVVVLRRLVPCLKVASE